MVRMLRQSEDIQPQTTPGQGDTEIAGLLEQILAEQKKIILNEGIIILSLIAIGKHLARLRSLAKRNWAKSLNHIPICPRVASRYLLLGESWLADIGLNESDLLHHLPADLMKLEWVCRLNANQLQELLRTTDPKKASRSEVIRHVKEILGHPGTNKPAQDPGRILTKLCQRLLTLAEEAIGESRAEEKCSSIRALLSDCVRQVERLLTGDFTSAKGDPIEV